MAENNDLMEFLNSEFHQDGDGCDVPAENGSVIKSKNGEVETKNETISVTPVGRKRPLPPHMQSETLEAVAKAYVPPPQKRRRSSLRDMANSNKNPLMLINEILGPTSTEFTILSSSGPSHAPVFVVECRPTVSVGGLEEGIVFRGEGYSKQKAKHAAAQLMLKELIQVQGGDMTEFGIDQDSNFTSDSLSGPGITNFTATPETQRTPQPSPTVSKHPVSVLLEKDPGAKFTFTENRDPGNQNSIRFVAEVTVQDRQFVGEARCKKVAKMNAAACAVLDLYGIECGAEFGGSQFTTDSDPMSEVEVGQWRGREFADLVQTKVREKFRTVVSKLQERFLKRKVIAGIVATRPLATADSNNTNSAGKEKREEEMKILCVTTGTKCLSGSNMSGHGTAVNDCHAEVLARRCLMRILLKQILRLEGAQVEEETEEDRWPLLERVDQEDAESPQYRLSPGIEFHLYISSAPCGDSRIFLPLGEATSGTPPKGEPDDHPNRRNRSLLRTKIECGEGTIPITSDSGIQTWDGVVHGERLLTMSCSDKVCLWNVVGLQGALMSSLLNEPIYLSSLVLGSLFKSDHLRRAVYTRASGAPLPDSYRAVCPRLLTVTSQDERVPGKSPNFGVNWLCSDPDMEVVWCTKGKLENDSSSRLCKRSFFELFSRALGSGIKPGDHLTYADAKARSGPYMAAKRALVDHFKAGGLGTWTGRPLEEDGFSLCE